MPLSHQKLASGYLQLAQHLEAGVTLAGALRASFGLGQSAPAIERAARLVEGGASVDQALRALERELPSADCLFLSAGAETGRMPRILRNLATRHAHAGSAKLRLVLASLYPLAVLHAGILLFPLLPMINWEKGFLWDASGYVRTLAVLLLPLWALVVALGLLARRQSPVLGQIGQWLPLFRGFVLAQRLADFAFGLGNFLEAGMLVDRAWLAAGLVAHSPQLLAASQEMDTRITQGQAPGTLLHQYPCFPADFVALYRTGESTGHLEHNLFHLATLQQERADRQLKLATMVYPSALFVLVAAVIAYQVISFYSGYFKMLGDLAQ